MKKMKILKTKNLIVKTTSPNSLSERLRIICAAKLLPLFLLLLSAQVSNAGQSGDFYYTANGVTATITNYTGAGGAVSIPSTVNGLTVVGIGDSAFSYSAVLTSVTIPDSVTSIGNDAFRFGYVLTNVVIGNSVAIIGYYAFGSCPVLTDIMIPASVTNFYGQPFLNSGSLTNIAVDPANPAYRSVDGVLFDKSVSTLIQFPGGRGGSYTIPFGVKIIQIQACSYLYNLTNIVIPDSVTNLGSQAFGDSHFLTDVTIGTGVTDIGIEAFQNCFGLRGVYFKGDAPSFEVPDLGSATFLNDNSATVFYFPDTATGWGATFGGRPTAAWSHYNYAVDNGAITITSYNGPGGGVNIPDLIDGMPVVGIGPNAFKFDLSVTNVAIPDSVASIGDSAFLACANLTGVTFGNGLTNIGPLGFALTSLTSVTLPDSLTSSGSYAFESCNSLTNVTFGNGLTRIEQGTFSYCPKLNSVTFGSDVTSIGYQAFAFNDGLTSVTLPDSVTSIESLAFEVCNNLTNVTMGNNITDIGSGAFFNCLKLISVTIGSGVTNIEDTVFEYCYGLKNVYFRGNAPNLGSNVFYQDTHATVYYLPWTSGWTTMYGGLLTKLWLLPLPEPLIISNDPAFGARTNRFGFNIYWATNATVVVEACTNLANPDWIPVGTNVLTDTVGFSYFGDADWTDYPDRFYRLTPGP
jgi:BspA type Leucine rich repeat region (6 copies)